MTDNAWGHSLSCGAVEHTRRHTLVADTLGRFLSGLGKVVVSERPLDLEHRMDLIVDSSLAVDVTVSSSGDPLARAEQQLIAVKSNRYLALCVRQNLQLKTFTVTPTRTPTSPTYGE